MKQFVFMVTLLFALAGCRAVPAARQTTGPETTVSAPQTVAPERERSPAVSQMAEEDSISLTNAQDPQDGRAAYVRLSADGTEAVVTLPGKAGVKLTRSFTSDGPRWTQAGEPLLLERLPEGWRLFENGMLAYWACNPRDEGK